MKCKAQRSKVCWCKLLEKISWNKSRQYVAHEMCENSKPIEGCLLTLSFSGLETGFCLPPASAASITSRDAGAVHRARGSGRVAWKGDWCHQVPLATSKPICTRSPGAHLILSSHSLLLYILSCAFYFILSPLLPLLPFFLLFVYLSYVLSLSLLIIFNSGAVDNFKKQVKHSQTH